MQVEELNPLPETAEHTVADPAGQGGGPQDHRNSNQMPKIPVASPGDKGRAWVGGHSGMKKAVDQGKFKMHRWVHLRSGYMQRTEGGFSIGPKAYLMSF